MAFEVGERITSLFTGPGTVVGPLERDDDQVAVQRVRFDNPVFGERLREVRRMYPFEDEPTGSKAKIGTKIQKEGGDGTQA